MKYDHNFLFSNELYGFFGGFIVRFMCNAYRIRFSFIYFQKILEAIQVQTR